MGHASRGHSSSSSPTPRGRAPGDEPALPEAAIVDAAAFLNPLDEMVSRPERPSRASALNPPHHEDSMHRPTRPAAARLLLRPLAALALAALSQGALAQEKPAEAAPPAAEPRVSLIGYGEINLNRPTTNGPETTMDVRRFVFGFLYRFDEKTKFVSEVEIEHAVSSADDPGEVEIEQAYIERQFTSVFSGRAGLMLMPVGLLNENHEPTAYYGVERNFVETAIIPTTWREGGLQAVANFAGFTVQAGASTSFNLNKWDFGAAGEGGAEPLGSIHQELAQARAHDWAGFGAVNYRGVPGLLVGASGFAGRASQGQPGVPSSTVSIWDAHARWTPWRLDLSALYARGNFSNTAALNAPHVGEPVLIPETFDGWYAQGAIRAWSDGDMALAPFVRYEQLNTGRSFADLGAGLTPAALPTEGVFTAGVNFYLTSGVVLKADIQRFKEATASNRVDLGLGWSF
jgi:hypothetical protein